MYVLTIMYAHVITVSNVQSVCTTGTLCVEKLWVMAKRFDLLAVHYCHMLSAEQRVLSVTLLHGEQYYMNITSCMQ